MSDYQVADLFLLIEDDLGGAMGRVEPGEGRDANAGSMSSCSNACCAPLGDSARARRSPQNRADAENSRREAG